MLKPDNITLSVVYSNVCFFVFLLKFLGVKQSLKVIISLAYILPKHKMGESSRGRYALIMRVNADNYRPEIA